MNLTEIVTKKDLEEFETRIIKAISGQLGLENGRQINTPKLKYLRTKDVKELLGITDNTVKVLRQKRLLSYVVIGSTYFYPENELISTLEKGLIRSKNLIPDS